MYYTNIRVQVSRPTKNARYLWAITPKCSQVTIGASKITYKAQSHIVKN
jgi:hypothetical protein